MMNARLNKAMVALLAVAAAGACDDPPIEPGSNDAERLVTNPSYVVIEAGESRLVQAYLVNDLGNPVVGDVDFEACDAAVTVTPDSTQTEIEPGNNFFIEGNTLGESCVNVSAGSFEYTLIVDVVPGSLELTGEAVVGSGEEMSTAVAFFDALGGAASGFDIDEIVFTTTDDEVAVVDDAGVVTGRAPGEAQIIATLDPEFGADRADTISIEVVPGVFSGTINPTAAEPGTVLTLTAGTAGFDDDTEISFTGAVVDPVIVSMTETELQVIVPCTATGEFLLTGLGENQVASTGTYTTTAEEELTAPIDCDARFFADGTHDHFYTVHVPAGGGSYTATLTFPAGADLDMYLIQNGQLATCGDDFFGCATATGDNPEQVTVTLEEGEYELYVNLFGDGGEDIVDYNVTIAEN